MAILSAPASRVGEITDSSAHRERNKQSTCRAGNNVEHRPALIAGGHDIEQNDFVRAIAGVSGGAFRRIAGVAQIYGTAAFHDPAVVRARRVFRSLLIRRRADPLHVLDIRAQNFRHAPGLGYAPARAMRRFAIENL